MNFLNFNTSDYNKYSNMVKMRAAAKKMQAAGTVDNPQYNVGHNFILSMFEDTIYDYMLRRLSVFNIIPSYEANGPAHMWVEQSKIPDNTQFSDPRTLAYKAIDADYGRLPTSAIVKCITSKFSIPYFDTIASRQQGAMPDFVQKDLNDWLFMFDKFINTKLIYGSDTSLSTPTTLEYMGLFNQITNKPVRLKTETTKTLTDIIETEVAKMDSDTLNTSITDANLVILMNTRTTDLWVKEERARSGNFRPYTNEFKPGFKVPSIVTSRGEIPIITENYLNVVNNTANTSTDHSVILLDRSKVERRYIGSATPSVFPWNMGNDQLSDDRLAVLFDTMIVRNPAKSHFNLTYQVAN